MVEQLQAQPLPQRGRIAAALDSDLLHAFLRSKITMAATLVTIVLVLAAVLAHWIAPQDPFDLRQLNLLDSHLPTAWSAGGDPRYLLGTDDQGRDVLSTILYGSRISLSIGVLSVGLAAALGIVLGLIAGYAGGFLDALIMRIADVQLTFPAILIALLIDGTVRTLFGEHRNETLEFWVLVLSIGLSFWVQYARTVRGSTMVEKSKDYVLAARLIGIHPAKILFRHVLPNVIGSVLVIATINLALAIITEATLSFLGVGLPPTQPSLGTLIRIGNNFLFAGEWWIAIFPGITLALLVIAINLLGDWLRDALNPRLR
ncbi:MAG TPA: ABC transporter permease [Xanthobacteraceae bacterium]|jgi:peptide/nickel transport system permease protein|nr:ABC transporter permease [Xanthobacteraceae bacterium]